MLGWEQVHAGKPLHAYEGHNLLPVCGDKESKRSANDAFPRTTYVGPMPPPPELICPTCQTWERERREIAGMLGREANRIYNKQDPDYPSNVLDIVSMNLTMGETEELSKKR